MTSLDEPAIVLNRGWTIVAMTTAAEALCKLYQGTAYAIDDDYNVYDFEGWTERPLDEGKPVVRTPRLELQVPDVIQLVAYDRTPQHLFTFSRYRVFRRDHYTCQYCARQVRADEVTLDHVLPRSRGGQSTWTNCVSACEPCNALKADRTPAEAGMALLRTPLRPQWSARAMLQRYGVPKTLWSRFVGS